MSSGNVDQESYMVKSFHTSDVNCNPFMTAFLQSKANYQNQVQASTVVDLEYARRSILCQGTLKKRARKPVVADITVPSDKLDNIHTIELIGFLQTQCQVLSKNQRSKPHQKTCDYVRVYPETIHHGNFFVSMVPENNRETMQTYPNENGIRFFDHCIDGLARRGIFLDNEVKMSDTRLRLAVQCALLEHGLHESDIEDMLKNHLDPFFEGTIPGKPLIEIPGTHNLSNISDALKSYMSENDVNAFHRWMKTYGRSFKGRRTWTICRSEDIVKVVTFHKRMEFSAELKAHILDKYGYSCLACNKITRQSPMYKDKVSWLEDVLSDTQPYATAHAMAKNHADEVFKNVLVDSMNITADHSDIAACMGCNKGVALCRWCNSKKGKMPIDEFLKKEWSEMGILRSIS